MKIGYPCINQMLGCTSNRTFRLRNYSEGRLRTAVQENLSCLERILEFNRSNGIYFFRIGSSIVPFASHPVCRFNWQGHFKKTFEVLGRFIKKNHMRISMHPDQFTLLNSPHETVTAASVRELRYHATVLETMGLGRSAKIQVHVGGVYGDKEKSTDRFITRYKQLPMLIKKHLVIENDDRLYTVNDCMRISKATGVPVLCDVFHHQLHNVGQSVDEALALCAQTWKKADGVLMVDYSSQKNGARRGAHTESINRSDFKRFISALRVFDCDIMLEIKDKERSAIAANTMLAEQRAG